MAEQHQGIGMTSQRTRNRLVQRLTQQGIDNVAVLIMRLEGHSKVGECVGIPLH